MQIFDVIIFFKLRTIQQKTVKPTCLCPLGARKLFRLIKKRSFNLLWVLALFSERWQSNLFQIFFFFSGKLNLQLYPPPEKEVVGGGGVRNSWTPLPQVRP